MSDKKVLALVNNIEITEEDLNALIRDLGPQRAAQFQNEEGQQRLLHELINQKLFYIDAIDNKMDEEKEFLDNLEIVKQKLLTQYSISKLLNNIQIDDEETKKYYDENKAIFVSPETVKASHILVEDEIKANNVLKEIKEGLSFEEAASKYSKCQSAQNGGDLGYFSRGKMVKEFEEAVFGMNKDEISKPVKTQFGFHLIKLVDRKDAEPKSYDEVKGQLKQQMLANKQDQTYMGKTGELREKHEVKVVKE